jgi:FAD/FMN-containing dehydrogenase
MDPTQSEKVTNPLALPASRRKALQALAALAGASGLSTLPGAANISGLDLGTAPALAKDAHDGPVAGGTKLTGELVFPGNPGYERDRLGYARQFSEFPLVIVFCHEVRDVVNALSWCREHNVALRARSGRHCLEGWSNLDGGVVIDVSHMKQLHINASAGVATVQTGLNQGEIVDALAHAGYVMPTGGERSVGVAGVALGGGIGLLSRSLGVASDNLIGVEMVIPSGKYGARVIHADKEHNADLLWASRGGGGGNFGIATSFTFKVHPMPDVTLYEAVWDWQYLTKLFSVWQDLAPSAIDALGSVYTPNSKINGTIDSYGILVGGSENQLRKLLHPMLKIGKPEVTFKTMPYLDAYNYLDRHPSLPANDKISSAWAYRPLPPEGIQVVRDFLAEAPNATGNIWCLNWGGAVGRIPSRATAFVHRKPQFYMEWESIWQESSEEEQNLIWVERFRKALQPYVMGSYVNVPDRSIGNWLSAYYGSNAERLREVKSKYDPYNVFNFEQSIPPAR